MIEEKIAHASEILDEKFHIKPQESKIYLHENIEAFLTGKEILLTML